MAVGCWLFSLWIVGLPVCRVFTCKMSGKRKQTALDLAQKIVIINDIEAGKKQAAVAAACNYCCD